MVSKRSWAGECAVDLIAAICGFSIKLNGLLYMEGRLFTSDQ